MLLSAWAVSDPAKYKLGPDLSGGTILIYQLSAEQSDRSVNIEKLLPALKERLDPAGLFNYVIRPVGQDRVEIILPRAETEDVDRVKRLISTVGQLQFKIVANRRRHSELIDRADAAWPAKLIGEEGVFLRYGQWSPLLRNSKNQETIDKAEAAWPNRAVSPLIRYKPAVDVTADRVDPKTHVVRRGDDGREYVLSSWSNDDVGFNPTQNLLKEGPDGDHYVLMVNDQYDVTGKYLTRVAPVSHDGMPAVSFNFDSRGARLFYELTGEYQPESDGYKSQLGVVLDNMVRSAPALNARISSSGVITGNFTEKQVNELVRILDAGQLPLALDKEPSSTYQIAATLGADTIRDGTIALVGSLVLVMAFVIIYYRSAGAIAIAGLLLNLLFTVALMVLFRATWTLPGLAGLVLTVGMSVDANILIFERMREELDHGASFGHAINLGYDKAFSAILDGNLTTVLTAVILFLIGTDQVKGFAVTLILGIATSMFCVLYVTRTIFEILYRRRWMKSFKIRRILTKPNYDFLKARKICYALSLTLIAAGLAAFAYRGRNNLDIDFTGGTMVGMQFTKPLDTAQVRAMAGSKLADVSVEEVTLPGAQSGTYYVVRTTDRDNPNITGGAKLDDTVRGRLGQVFRDYLSFASFTFDPPTPIGAPSQAKIDPALAPFVGGSQTILHFDRPRSVDYVRNQLADLLSAGRAQEMDASNLYGLVPIPGPEPLLSEITGVPIYKDFHFGMKGDLAGTLKGLQDQLASNPVFEQFNQFGPQVAQETQARALWAIVLSWLSIIVYVWFRFGSWTFGLAGVVALVHDVLVAVGVTAIVSILANMIPGLSALSLTDMKINLNGIAAILTLIGYSINDTIVIFDRIREIRGKSPKLTPEIVNRAVNETLSRTLFTSFTVFMAVVVLYFGCGIDLRGFSFILVIGTITGVYSTVYIANPVLLALSDWRDRRQHHPSSAPSSNSKTVIAKA